MVRVGIVGIGFGQHVHVPAFRLDPRVSVDAICASTVERARTVAERLVIPRAYGDWRALLADPALDAVAISVPATLQPQIAIAAAAAGKHLFLEKPLAPGTEGAEAIATAAARAGVHAVVDFEFREVPQWRHAREMSKEGAIGTLRRIHIAWHLETVASRSHPESWKLDAERGGGVLNLFVSHSLDAVRWLAGAEIARIVGRLGPSRARECAVDVWLDMANGIAATITASTDAPGGSGHRVELQGDAGALVLENRTSDHLAGFTLEHSTREGRAAIAVPPFPVSADGRLPPVAAIVRRLVDAIEGGAAATPSIGDGVAVQRAIDQIRGTRWSS